MSNIDSMLNSLYCLSQVAARTIDALRVYPNQAKNANIRLLYMLMLELRANTLEAYRNINNKECMCHHFSEILSKGPCIQQTFEALVNTVSLKQSHTVIKKLKFQVSSILLMLANLTETFDKIKIFDEINLVVQ